MKKGSCTTKGREDVISKTYKEISDVIKKNAAVKVDDVVKKIAGLSRSAWYKCISKGPRRGLVSNVTITKLANFSGLSEDVFSGLTEFTAEHKQALADKIKESFGKDSVKAEDKKVKAEKKEKAPKKEKKAKKVKKEKKAKKIKTEKKEKAPKKEKKIKAEKKEKAAKKLLPAKAEKAAKKVKAVKGKRGRKPKKETIEKVKAIVEKIKVKREYKKAVVKETSSTVNKLKGIAAEIEHLNDEKQLESITEVLEKLVKITEKKIDFVSALKEL
jgi:chemotaxis protein histidine kinase CheA